jgi:glycolate oxidase
MNILDAFPHITSSSNPEDLACYGFDACGIEGVPSAVVWPETTEHVAQIMKYAHENGIPVVPRGAGTGMSGGAVPLGALWSEYGKMNRILRLRRATSRYLWSRALLTADCREWKPRTFHPPDPASMNFCTIGGNMAENAGAEGLEIRRH